MNVEYGNMQKNTSIAEELIHSAISQQCDLVLLPELWSTGFDYHYLDEYAEQNHMLIIHLQKLANESKIIIASSFIEKQGSQFFNSFNTLQPNLPINRYFKKHLFTPMHEDKYFSPGEVSIPFSTPLGLTALSVCYDLRFPEFFLDLRRLNTEIFLMSAHWPLVRISHWDVLLQARAIENQAYMVAVNSVGKSGKDNYGGHSAVIAPDGEVLLHAPDDAEGLFVVEIDPGRVKSLREKFIIHRKKKDDLFRDRLC